MAEDHVHDAILWLARRAKLPPDRTRGALVATAKDLATEARRRREEEQQALRLMSSAVSARVLSETPEAYVEANELVVSIVRAVRELAPGVRRVLVLRILGSSLRDIAAELGVPVKAVDNALTRARNKLRAMQL